MLSFRFLHFQACVCIMHGWGSHTCGCMWLNMWRHRLMLGLRPVIHPPSSLRRDLSVYLEAWGCIYFCQPACSAEPLLLSSEAGMTSGPLRPSGFNMSNVDLHSGPQDCVVSALTTEQSSPLPQMRILPLKIRQWEQISIDFASQNTFYKKS